MDKDINYCFKEKFTYVNSKLLEYTLLSISRKWDVLFYDNFDHVQHKEGMMQNENKIFTYTIHLTFQKFNDLFSTWNIHGI